MLPFEKVSKIYFSPSGTTKRIVDEVARNFNLDNENYDLLSFDDEKSFDNELVIVGVPVFDGRIPEMAKNRLLQMKANGTKVIAIINYGNLGYGDALLELVDLLKENNFDVVGAAATVSRHSLFNEIAPSRPDNLDMKMINEFSNKIIEKLESGNSNEIFVAGQKPFMDYVNHSFNVNCDYDLCVYCNDCVYTCPTDAIEEDNPTDTNSDLCNSCSLCIAICGENARSFDGMNYYDEKQVALDNDMSRKEVEFFM